MLARMTLAEKQLSDIEAACHAAGGYLPAAVVDRIVASGVPLDQLMLGLIPMAQTFAIPPISNFFVGAIVCTQRPRTED